MLTYTNKQRRTRQTIIDAMFDLLETHAFDEITIASICETALIHHTTFYRYFDDKYALLGATMNAMCEPMIAATEQGHSFMGALVEVLSSHREIMRNVTAKNKSNAVYYDLITITAQQLVDAAQTNHPSADNVLERIKQSKNPAYTSYAIAGMVIGVFIKWSQNEDPLVAKDFGQYFNQDFGDLFKIGE